MAVLAMRHAGILCAPSNTAQHVNNIWHRLKVRWVAAQRHAAKMIERQSVWNWPDFRLIGHSVNRLAVAAIDLDAPITLASTTKPQAAPGNRHPCAVSLNHRRNFFICHGVLNLATQGTGRGQRPEA